jgi:poly [ADP-ribose] polymerase
MADEPSSESKAGDAGASGEQPEEQLAPYLIEEARSSRSRCRTCRTKIDKGKLRLGILLEGPYGTGYLWHHLTCAAKRKLDDVEAAYEEGAFAEGVEPPPLDELRALKEKADKKKAEKQDPPYVERDPSGRAKCKHCDEKLEKGALRVVLQREVTFGNQVRGMPIHVHPRCVAPETMAEDCMTELEGLEQELRANSRGVDAAEIAEVMAIVSSA